VRFVYGRWSAAIRARKWHPNSAAGLQSKTRKHPDREEGEGMNQSMTEMPALLFNLRCDNGKDPYVVSCSIVGDTTGLRGLVRRFASLQKVESELKGAGISSERYASILAAVDAERGSIKHFDINLNEAQKLSIIQIDSTE
jgi:hypothetical protein